MVTQYGTLYQDTRRALLETESAQDAGVLARMLICHVTGKDQAQFLAERDLYAPEDVVKGVHAGLERLLKGEPIAYILGPWEFYGLPLRITPDVLIPRDDTCAVAELAIRQALFLDQNPRILDLCCGSGCIGLAIAKRVKDARVTLADLSQNALTIARENTAMHKMGGRVRCVRVDAMQPASTFLGKFDLIVSNPPYVTAEEMSRVIIAYEPVWAIGTGRTATSEQAEEVCAAIRKVLGELYGEEIAEATVVQYGGSMNAANAEELLLKPNVDGGLIGGASLKADAFGAIVAAASK